MEVSGSHGGAKQQQRVFVVVGSCREPLRAIGSRQEPWESTSQPKYLDPGHEGEHHRARFGEGLGRELFAVGEDLEVGFRNFVICQNRSEISEKLNSESKFRYLIDDRFE